MVARKGQATTTPFAQGQHSRIENNGDHNAWSLGYQTKISESCNHEKI